MRIKKCGDKGRTGKYRLFRVADRPQPMRIELFTDSFSIISMSE
ncbi:hypothetical protein [Paraburkholderia diazotrophica]|nr:hypothetical protein [Paraburkholderia diazotrophica]